MRVIDRPSIKDIEFCAEVIKSGGVVVFPTETVYGIGANAFDPDACRKIFKIKKRPFRNPLIVHICDLDMLHRVVAHVEERAKKLIEKFWPGPLTIVFEKKRDIPGIVTANLKTVAVRFPSDKIAQRLIKAAGVPIAAPSANVSGYVSPTDKTHIIDDFKNERLVDVVLFRGKTKLGLESTIVDVTQKKPVILRLGSVTVEEIEKTLKVKVEIGTTDKQVLAPGMLKRHYSPCVPLYLFEDKDNLLRFILKNKDTKRIGLIAEEKLFSFLNDCSSIVIKKYKNIAHLAKNLYRFMREMDNMRLDLILALRVKESGLGRAINDRLCRAAKRIY